MHRPRKPGTLRDILFDAEEFSGRCNVRGSAEGIASGVCLCGQFHFTLREMGRLEMCWSRIKFVSLVVVVCGILIYGTFTTEKKGKGEILSMRQNEEDKGVGGVIRKDGKIMCV